MRKPALERLMTAAADGNGAAREIFRRIGLNLAALTEEMEYLLSTGTDSRYIFGRFAKIPGCFCADTRGLRLRPARHEAHRRGRRTCPQLGSCASSPDSTA